MCYKIIIIILIDLKIDLKLKNSFNQNLKETMFSPTICKINMDTHEISIKLRKVIGPLHKTVAWYTVCHTGWKIVRWGFLHKATILTQA